MVGQFALVISFNNELAVSLSPAPWTTKPPMEKARTDSSSMIQTVSAFFLWNNNGPLYHITESFIIGETKCRY
jgi:hypothetical protein